MRPVNIYKKKNKLIIQMKKAKTLNKKHRQ